MLERFGNEVVKPMKCRGFDAGVWCECSLDDEALNQDLPELINDDVEDEGEGSADEAASDHNASGDSGKRRHRDDSDIDEDLEEEDYDLIEENLGVRVDRVCVFIFIAGFVLMCFCPFV